MNDSSERAGRASRGPLNADVRRPVQRQVFRLSCDVERRVAESGLTGFVFEPIVINEAA